MPGASYTASYRRKRVHSVHHVLRSPFIPSSLIPSFAPPVRGARTCLLTRSPWLPHVRADRARCLPLISVHGRCWIETWHSNLILCGGRRIFWLPWPTCQCLECFASCCSIPAPPLVRHPWSFWDHLTRSLCTLSCNHPALP